MKRDSSEDFLGKYEVVFGQHLDRNDPQLSPKVKQIVLDKMDIDQILEAPDDSPKLSNPQKFATTTTAAPMNTGEKNNSQAAANTGQA